MRVLIPWHRWWPRLRPGPFRVLNVGRFAAIEIEPWLRSTTVSIESSQPCPCESGHTYGSCCGPIHTKDAGLGTTAEQLMRARYSAYVLHNADFLLRSWHPDTRPEELSFSSGHTWHGLTIVETSGGGGLESDGIVEFKARFKRDDDHFELHERSSFSRIGGKWVYVDGFDPDQR